jgi:hypothetical protein
MAYDLMVGKSNKVKDKPEIVGAIEFEELATLGKLQKRAESFFLQRISNLFDDQTFSIEEINQAQKQLLELLKMELSSEENNLLYKLLAIMSFAKNRNLPLHGVAD